LHVTTHVRDRAVRDALKLPKEIAAKLCGVSVPTLRQYEADPLSVSENSRAKCAAQYAKFREWAAPLLALVSA
jgi:hypothetical protein